MFNNRFHRVLFLMLLIFFARVSFAQQKLIHFWDFNDTYPFSGTGIVPGTRTQADSLGTATVLTQTGIGPGDTLFALPASYTTLSSANPHIRYFRPQGLQGNALLEDSVVDNASGGSYLYDYCSRHYTYFKRSDSTHAGRNCYVKSLQPNLNSYFYLYMPTTGYHNINLNFALSGSGANMAKYLIFSYSTDSGSTWKNLTQAMDTFNIGGVHLPDTLQALNPITGSSRWYPVGINFSSDTTVSNNSKFILRFTFALASPSAPNSSGASSSSGSVHFDNFALKGDSICPAYTVQPTTIGICVGSNGSSILSVIGGIRNAYQWQVNQGSGFNNINNGGVYGGATTDTLKFTDVPSTMNNYTYRCVLSSGTCANNISSVKTLTVFPLPNVQAEASADSVCAGTDVTLWGNNASYYVWSGGVQTELPFIPLATSTYTVTGTDGNGCINTSTITITVNSLPLVTARANLDSVCPGGMVTLNEGGNASSYSWSGGVTNGVAFAPSGTATYTVTGTAVNGCTASSSVLITVNPKPPVAANPSSGAICSGSSISLFGTGAQTYVWTGGVRNNVAFEPSSSKSYTVTGTDSHGCTATSVTTISVNPLPRVIAMTSADSVCQDSSVTLTAKGASGYVWSGGVLNGMPFIPLATENYRVTGTDTNGCVSYANIIITVNTPPLVTANASRVPDCVGYPDTLKGGGALIYSWTGGRTDRVGFIPLSTNSYTVTGTDSHGCMNTASILIAVDSIPQVYAYSTSTEICAGASTVLFGGGAQSYNWSGGPVDDMPYVLYQTTTFTVTGTDANGCMDTASIKILVDSLPVAYAGTFKGICPGGSRVELGGPGIASCSYSWSPASNLTCPFCSETSGVFTVTTIDTLSVLNNNTGCMNSDTVTVLVYTPPLVRAISSDSVPCNGIDIILSGAGAKTYSWTDGVEDSVQFIPSGIKTYTVTGTDAHGCTGTASTKVSVEICTGIRTFGNQTQILIYPNPAAGNFMISGLSGITILQIYNLGGKLVNELKTDFAELPVSLDGMPDGIYFLRVLREDNSIIWQQKIVKQE